MLVRKAPSADMPTTKINSRKLAGLVAAMLSAIIGYASSPYFFGGIAAEESWRGLFSNVPPLGEFFLLVGLLGVLIGVVFQATERVRRPAAFFGSEPVASFPSKLFYACLGFGLLGTAVWLGPELLEIGNGKVPALMLLVTGGMLALFGQLVGACIRGLTKMTWRWLRR